MSPKSTSSSVTDWPGVGAKTESLGDLVFDRAGQIAEKRGGDAKEPSPQDFQEAWEVCIRDELEALVGTKNAQEDITQTIEAAKKDNRWYEKLAVAVALFYGLAAVYLIVAMPFWNFGDSLRIAAVVCGTLANVVLLVPLRHITRSRRYNIELDLFGHLVKTSSDKKTMLQVLKQLSKSLIESDKK